MTKRVLGSYETVKEALHAADVYALGGHSEDNIIMLTNEENAAKLEGKTPVQIKTDNPSTEPESASFIDKVKDVFTPAEEHVELDTTEKMTAFGLSQQEADSSMEEVKNGHIVIIVDDELRMGHTDERYDLDELES